MNGAIVGITNFLVGATSAALLFIGHFAWHTVVALVVVGIAAVALSIEASL